MFIEKPRNSKGSFEKNKNFTTTITSDTVRFPAEIKTKTYHVDL